MIQPTDKIYVAGHRGLVGGAVVRCLERDGFTNIVTRTRDELDLTRQDDVTDFFADEKPDYVVLAAAKVGGIYANDTYPADFIRENLQVELNVIDSAYRSGVRKLVFLGSSCIYPRMAPQPMPESCLMTGPLEPTNQWYAMAKISGIMLCQAYAKQHGFQAISLMPTNLYGPGDNFHPSHSHVLPALMRRFHEAKTGGASEVVVWGTGTPRREFLYVDDMADATVFLMRCYNHPEIVNVGTGTDVSIRELVEMLKEVVGFKGKLRFDTSKPDGTPRKLLDTSKINSLGWQPATRLREGLTRTYRWFLENQDNLRGVEAVETAKSA